MKGRHLRGFILAPIVVGMAFTLRNEVMAFVQCGLGAAWLCLTAMDWYLTKDR
jgi:hypothetical protein